MPHPGSKLNYLNIAAYQPKPCNMTQNSVESDAGYTATKPLETKLAGTFNIPR